MMTRACTLTYYTIGNGEVDNEDGGKPEPVGVGKIWPV